MIKYLFLTIEIVERQYYFLVNEKYSNIIYYIPLHLSKGTQFLYSILIIVLVIMIVVWGVENSL